MKVGFVGLGNMGMPMAQNLIRAGHELIVFNRTRGRAEQLDGARIANSPAAVARSADAVITMLADDGAVEDVVLGDNGILADLPAPATHISCSTISAALSQKLTEAHRGRSQDFVAAPVFGRPQAAEAAKLFIVAAGPPQALARCEPLFRAFAQKTFVIGDEPLQANVAKLSGNFLIAAVIECLGEALALVRKYQVDPAAYMDLLTGTLFAAPVYKTYGEVIVQEKYEPAGFRLRLGLKDVRLALQAAESAEIPMPVASLLRDHALAAIANGMGDMDWSVLAKLAAKNAGL